MIWSFGRGEEIVRLQTSYDTNSHDFILEITRTDRPPTIERFTTVRKFKTRVLAVERQLADEHWTQIGSPEILPHIWRGPTTH
jgi:hypothetical protein